jgi:polysaccharide deacetylase 2 family uncharacterized protein YibQ
MPEAKKTNNSEKSKRNKRNSMDIFLVLLGIMIVVVVFFYPVKKVEKPSKPAAKATVSKTEKKKASSATTHVGPTQVRTSAAVTPKLPPTITPPVKKVEPKKKLASVPKGPKIVIVIDDMGQTNHDQDILEALGDRVTYAILPHLPYSQHFSVLSQKTKAEVIVHMPLEANDGRFPGPGVITTQMTTNAVLKHLYNNLENVPYHVGINNHMGSKATANRALMKTILGELKKRNLFFLDSYTSKDSVAVDVARSIQLPVLKRDVFLDNDITKESIREQINLLADTAGRKGYAIGICHYHDVTLQVLLEEIPRLQEEGYALVHLSDLL